MAKQKTTATAPTATRVTRSEGGDEGKTPRNVGANLGPPTPEPIRRNAEKLPEKDEVQKAYKKSLTTESAQEEARQKVEVVEASPNAEETPSGHALKKIAGESNDTERGEKYAREKTAKRWGYTPVE